MAYTLKFSDPTKLTQVTVPDMPPGINNIDTSVSLVGKGYPNYGLKVAENFLHMLENFSSPIPPENPIEGQLWYDTSDPTHKVLRVMDGTATSTRWPSASGIYQQATDPRDTGYGGLKVGDIWVDTASNQLKIFNSNDWTLVGPDASSSITGPVPKKITDTLGVDHWVILNYIDGNVMSIISSDNFTPQTVISGFTSIRKGITVPLTGIFFGTANAANSLEINSIKYSAANFLRKNDQSGTGQVITGKVVYQTPSDQVGAVGRDGVIINTGDSTDFIQLLKSGSNAVLLNYKQGGKIVFQTKPSTSSTLEETLTIESKKVAINTTTNALSPTLDVYGTVRILNTLTMSSTASEAITVAGGIGVSKSLSIGSNLLVSGITTSTGALKLGTASGSGAIIVPNNTGTYDIGSPTMPFRNLYVSGILASTGTVIYGSISGNASGLKNASTFKLQGQVTATSFLFAGTGTEATFNTTLTTSAIDSQTRINTGSDSITLLAIDTSTTAVYSGVAKISRKTLLGDISFPGIISPYGGATAPTGWLLCDGTSYTTSTYSALYSVVGYNYGGSGSSFNVPNLTGVTTAVGGFAVRYIIKT